MRTCPRTVCYLCGSGGETRHQGLVDSLTNAPGVWTIRKCSSASCGLLWLDPAPLDEDLPMAYADYVTHRPLPRTDGTSRTAGALAVRMGALIGRLPAYARIREEHARRSREYLGDLHPGRLLEAGCGNGSRLRKLRDLGWDVLGQDIDPQAVAVAAETGVPVHLGPLEEALFPSGSFDAILMAHVIEHVSDPIGFLSECRRILRPGGRLVAITPNANSFGHGRFGDSWIGLDPPRHLYLFTASTLRSVAGRAGFARGETWTTEANAFSILSGSLHRRREGRYPSEEPRDFLDRSLARAFQYWTALELLADPDSGEECVLVATAP